MAAIAPRASSFAKQVSATWTAPRIWRSVERDSSQSAGWRGSGSGVSSSISGCRSQAPSWYRCPSRLAPSWYRSPSRLAPSWYRSPSSKVLRAISGSPVISSARPSRWCRWQAVAPSTCPASQPSSSSRTRCQPTASFARSAARTARPAWRGCCRRALSTSRSAALWSPVCRRARQRPDRVVVLAVLTDVLALPALAVPGCHAAELTRQGQDPRLDGPGGFAAAADRLQVG